MKNPKKDHSVDQYIEIFPPEIRKRLDKVRATIRKAAPGAAEKISYQMPAFTFNGILVYFAGFKNHIGFYPLTSAMTAFRDELSSYETGRGSVRFPHDKPLPLRLISDMVKFRVQENLLKLESRSGKSAAKRS